MDIYTKIQRPDHHEGDVINDSIICPFCGSEAVRTEDIEEFNGFVYNCGNCENTIFVSPHAFD